MKNLRQVSLMIVASALIALPTFGQSNLVDISDLNDLSSIRELTASLSGQMAGKSMTRSSDDASQLDHFAYLLEWNYTDMAYDSAFRQELITEEVDGKLNWTLIQDSYESPGSYLPGERVEVYNARIGMLDDGDDPSLVPADSLLFYIYDDATKEYELFVTSYYYENAFGKLDYAVITIYFYGLPFFGTIQQNYYDGDERLVAQTTGDGISAQDSTVYRYNGMDQLTQEVSFSYDEYGTLGFSSLTDYSYNEDESLMYFRKLSFSDSLTTLIGVDSTSFVYPTEDMYTESAYFFDPYEGGFVLDFYVDYTSIGNKEIEERYEEGQSGLVNVSYSEGTFDECDRIVEGLDITRLFDGTEETRDTSIYMYREEPSCTVSTYDMKEQQNQFTYTVDDQLLTVHLEESDRGILSMFSADGRTVRTVKYDGMQGQVDVSQLVSGVYYVSVTGERIRGVIGVFVK